MRNSNTSSTRKITRKPKYPRRAKQFKQQLFDIQGLNFESLETRELMATINVTDFGAVANDGRDDRGSVLAAINASRPGDTVRFSGGTFNISDVMNLPGDRTYKGESGATLQGRGGEGSLFDLHVNNVTVTGLTFNGGGIFIDKPGGGMNQNIVLDHNRFNLNTSGSKSNAITFTSGLQNSRITNNYITGYQGGFGMYGYNYQGLTIANNELVNVRAGMHIDAFGGCGNLLVQNNYISGAQGMGMEFQGSANNNKYYDNVYEHPNLSSNYNSNLNSMAYSLILDKSSNIEIKRNSVIAPERPDGTGCRVGFEVGGDNTIVEDNYINGVSITVANNDGVGSGSVIVRNNKFMGYQQKDYQAFPAPGRTYQSYNNGANVNLTWDVNRTRPGVDRNAGAPITNPAPTPTPTPVPTPEPQYGITTAVRDDQTVRIVLGNIPSGATQVTFESISTVGRETGEKVGPIKTIALSAISNKTVDIAGYHPGWQIDLRAVYKDASGKTLGTTSYSSVKMSGDPTVTWPATNPTPEPTPTPTPDPTLYRMDVNVVNDQTLRYVLGNIPAGATSVTLECISTVGRETGAKVGQTKTFTISALTNKTVDIAGYHPGWKIDVRAMYRDSNGTLLGHTPWMTTQMTGDSTVRWPQLDTTPLPPVVKYLGELDWSVVKNGWGAPELNKSNGETAANDGHTLKLAGKTYSKGIGAHSNSEIHYQLDGKYATFTADIGIDDEVGSRGTVTFQVWADGVKLYDSGTMTGGSATKTINVNVQGRSEMWLVVTDNGDGRFFDHADWADARLVMSPLVATVSGTSSVSSVKLSSPVSGLATRTTSVNVGGSKQLWLVIDDASGDDYRVAA